MATLKVGKIEWYTVAQLEKLSDIGTDTNSQIICTGENLPVMPVELTAFDISAREVTDRLVVGTTLAENTYLEEKHTSYRNYNCSRRICRKDSLEVETTLAATTHVVQTTFIVENTPTQNTYV